MTKIIPLLAPPGTIIRKSELGFSWQDHIYSNVSLHVVDGWFNGSPPTFRLTLLGLYFGGTGVLPQYIRGILGNPRGSTPEVSQQ